MNWKKLVLALFLMGLSFAEFSIPSDQPICNLCSIIKRVGTVAGVLVAAYAGFTIASSTELNERNQAKTLLGGVAVGLIVIWIAPLIVTNLVDATSVCGWTS